MKQSKVLEAINREIAILDNLIKTLEAGTPEYEKFNLVVSELLYLKEIAEKEGK